MNWLTWLNGKKTYLCAGGAGIVTAAYALNMISQGTWQVLMGLLVSGGAAALKSGQVSESAKIIEKVQRVEDRECADKP